MSMQGLLEFDGQVTHASQGGLVHLTLDNNVEMLTKVCGNVRCRETPVIPGERVRVSVSPYDLTRGLIVCRDR